MPGREVKKNYRYCYNAAYTGLDTILPINGFYMTIRNSVIWDQKLKTEIPNIDTISMVFYPDGLFYSYYQWGNYRILEDTIITNSFNGRCNTSWGGWESKYMINDDKTLTLFAGRPLRTETQEMTKRYSESRKKTMEELSNAFFVKSDSLPNKNNCWLLDAKWFRCDE